MRLDGLDIARFLAFLGMVLVNFRIAAEVSAGGDLPSLLTNALEGRAAALFVVLAGIGLGLARATAPLIFRRALFLMALGLLNLTIFEADILHYYGTYFFCALPFLGASTRVLWGAAVAITLLALGTLIFGNYDQGWDWDTLSYTGFWTVSGYLRHTFYNGWHPVLPWLSFLFIGMALARLDLASARVQARLAVWGAVAMVAGMIPATLITSGELMPLFGTSPIPPTPFYILSASGSAALMVALCLWAGPMLMRFAPSRAMALAGRQSLTLYLAHILLGMGLLEGLGLLSGVLSPGQIFAYALGFCALCLIYASLWQHVAKRGPLEALMRRVAG
ncbi:DUF418 domain-containing protein [Thalassovita sp.]|uniref:DUF418 domain-containing protein n=1 Tax=Thalassovita sp. TaxID=1979401 RepID=UPI002AAFF358|nr:DUF418 domain-containing protein [Thalassovita sp.]